RTHPSFNASFQASLPPRLWDPASQLRFERKRSVPPRPDGAPNTGQGRATREAAARGAIDERSAA
ncbi:MAG TPA: hypothetical protein VMU39_30310, partial [Solirubrobacteraceae bacterium]|nr:hypothetical protein [Solirubrobacteraceae bacterium]